MSASTRSGIKTSSDGSSYIPASKRSDGSTRKEIRVRPGYTPPEDVDSYRNRTAEAWRNRGKGGIPGVDPTLAVPPSSTSASEPKSQNARRREAARRSKAIQEAEETGVNGQTEPESIESKNQPTSHEQAKTEEIHADNDDAEGQKKIRNQLKKLKAIRELKEKKTAGEKLSPDQLMKMARETELLRDLKKLGYNGDEVQDDGDVG